MNDMLVSYLILKKISEDNINYILEIGRLSASSFGMEHWQFITISDNEIKKRFKKPLGINHKLPHRLS